MESLLAYIGAATLVLITYALLRLIVTFICYADFDTARTKKLAENAFADQVVWITGASSGIGREMALLLAPRGAHLILSSRRKEALDKVAEDCRAAGASSVKVLPLDLNDRKSLPEKAKEALSHKGRVDVMVNNGGVSTRVMGRDVSIDLDEYLTQVDYLAHVALVKAVLPSMEKTGGRIINIGSVASRIPVPVRTAYCGAKHALFGFMGALRAECMLLGHDIHILNICLGSTKTALDKACLVGVTGRKIETFSQKDPNIQGGMDPTFVAERVLAVSYEAELIESWIARGKEMLGLFLVHYLPQTGFRIVMKGFAKKFAVEKKKEE